MARPTIADVRRLLDNLGVPQVDPSSWFDGTMPEILRASLDFGRVQSILARSQVTTLLYSTDLAVGLFLDLVVPRPNEIIVCRNLSIRFTTANVDTINVRKLVGPSMTEIWTDSATPFALAPYIGTNNDASRAWGALGLNNIPVFGENPEFSNQPQLLQLNLESAAVVDKFARITFDTDTYEWQDWPGW